MFIIITFILVAEMARVLLDVRYFIIIIIIIYSVFVYK